MKAERKRDQEAWYKYEGIGSRGIEGEAGCEGDHEVKHTQQIPQDHDAA
jgi:hypothetical protein